ncbi:MAG: M23 family metallopeptidase, partial [Defluviitaleaceae bacterium]|nr:M23 family metallopeptidase [Defluviitaleaceae bacterium]
SPATLTLRDQGTMVRPGYVLVGWINEWGNTYPPGFTWFDMRVGTFTFDAVWAPISNSPPGTVTIVYRNHGHTGGNVPAPQVHNVPATITLSGPGNMTGGQSNRLGGAAALDGHTLYQGGIMLDDIHVFDPSSNLVRPGYVFRGWRDSRGNLLQAGHTWMQRHDGRIYLDAEWQRNCCDMPSFVFVLPQGDTTRCSCNGNNIAGCEWFIRMRHQQCTNCLYMPVEQVVFRSLPACFYVFYGELNWTWPVPDSHMISSGFRVVAGRPGGDIHTGLDIVNEDGSALRGRPVLAAHSGEVIFRGWTGGWPIVNSDGGGYGIKIRSTIRNHNKPAPDNDFIVTRYLHLQRMDVNVGDIVQQGMQIGTVGESGLVLQFCPITGDQLTFRVHLHFDVNGRNLMNITHANALNPFRFFPSPPFVFKARSNSSYHLNRF